ncbi:MAG: hypothetical protein HOV92_17940 [Streptomyces sp.]|nr:hypothetical protein [Streptomyces sp.]
MTYLLIAVLIGPVCWALGHRTARVHIVPLCTSCEAGEAALLADERRRFDQLVADFEREQPDDPRSSAV